MSSIQKTVVALFLLCLTPFASAQEIQVWAWNIAAASLKMLAGPFQQKHPGIAVNVNMTGANMQSRLLLALSAGVGAPDVSQIQVRELARYATTGTLADITDAASKYAGKFVPAFWQDCVYDGRVYAIPWDMGPCAVFYKRNVFERYGVDPDTIETWDDYIAAGRRLVEQSGGKTKMMCLPTGVTNDLFELLIQQNDCQIFDPEGRIAIYSPRGVEVIDTLRKMLQSGIGANIEFFSHPFYASFKSDSVASYPMASWFGGIVRDYAPETSGNWGLFRLPAFRPGGLRASNLGGSVLLIPAQGKHQEAAWAFAEHANCLYESQLAQYREFDLFPALVETHNDPFFDEEVPFFRGQKVRRIFSLDIDKIQPLVRTTDWMEATRYITQSLSTWANGDLAPSDAFLRQLEEKLSRRLEREISPASLSLQRGKGR